MSQRFQNTELILNDRRFFVNSLELSQSASIAFPKVERERISESPVAQSPVKTNLSLQYFLTGKDLIKDFISTQENVRINGNVGGLHFNYGYLENYAVSISPNSPISINANILIFDEISGQLTTSTPTNLGNLNFANSSDAIININGQSQVPFENINNINWTYSADINPSYYYRDSGFSRLSPDNIVIGEKTIETNITCDDKTLALSFSGDRASLEIICSVNNLTEKYACSGIIDSKQLTCQAGDIPLTNYSISQANINNKPTISSVDTSYYESSRIVVIYSTDKENGYFTPYFKHPIIERIFVGDSEATFEVFEDVNNDYIEAGLPIDAINGTLTLQTTRGTINYFSGLTLDHPQITISGFYPITGKPNDIITISGSNFIRISDVSFNGGLSNFNVDFNSTPNIIRAVLPQNALAGPIRVNSIQRNRECYSSNTFYPLMTISSLNPATGYFNTPVNIEGKNFSGVTGVYFNGIESPSINVYSNTGMTANAPAIGEGYAGGYVQLVGTQGMSNYSPNRYSPLIITTGIATDPVEITIQLQDFDADYLSPYLGGYKARVDDTDYAFRRYGITQSITGNINLQSRYPRIHVYRPNGIETYPAFTGIFTSVGPATTLSSIRRDATQDWTQGMNDRLLKYKKYNIIIKGNYFKDFEGYGLPWKAAFRHHHYPELLNPVETFQDHASDIEASASFSITGLTGYYDLLVQNGLSETGYTGILTGIIRVYPPVPISRASTIKGGFWTDVYPTPYPPFWGTVVVRQATHTFINYPIDHVIHAYTYRFNGKDTGFSQLNIINQLHGADPAFPNGLTLSLTELATKEATRILSNNEDFAAAVSINLVPDSGMFFGIELRRDWALIGGQEARISEIKIVSPLQNFAKSSSLSTDNIFSKGDHLLSHSGWVTVFNNNDEAILNEYVPNFRNGFNWSRPHDPLKDVKGIYCFYKSGSRNNGNENIGFGFSFIDAF